MIVFEHQNSESISRQIELFRKTQEVVFSNFFGLKDESVYEYCALEKTIFIREKEHTFYRLFFVSSNEEELNSALNHLHESEYVINIPTRVPIDEKIPFFNKAGFDLIGVYDRYYNKDIQNAYQKLCKLTANIVVSDNMEVAQLAKESEATYIWSLLAETFSLYMDHIPDLNELRKMIVRGCCFVNRYEGKVCGVNIFTPKKQILYDNCRVDNKGLGPFLSKNMVRYAIDNGIKVINYWIARDNKMIIKYHRIMGAVPDGLTDYSFLKTK